MTEKNADHMQIGNSNEFFFVILIIRECIQLAKLENQFK